MTKQNDVVGKNVFCFNPKDNGGEQLYLTTTFIANGDENGVFMNQELTLQSYCNSASFTLHGSTMTPDLLRELANQLDTELAKSKAKTQKEQS